MKNFQPIIKEKWLNIQISGVNIWKHNHELIVLTQSCQVPVTFDGVAVGRWRWERIKSGGNLKRSLKHGKPLCTVDSMAWRVVPCFRLWARHSRAAPPDGPILQSCTQTGDLQRLTEVWSVHFLTQPSLLLAFAILQVLKTTQVSKVSGSESADKVQSESYPLSNILSSEHLSICATLTSQ